MIALICKKCHNGNYKWIDDPDEVSEALMQCQNCGSITTMKKFCSRNRVKELFKKVKTNIHFYYLTVKSLGLFRVIYLLLKNYKERIYNNNKQKKIKE